MFSRKYIEMKNKINGECAYRDIDDAPLAHNILKGHNSETVRETLWSEFSVNKHCLYVS